MSGIYHQNKEWANVTTPNPAGTASTDLTKLGIDGVNYNVKDADAYHDGDLATVAETGNYSDLSNTPTIPTKTSDLINDSDFVESSDLATVATSGSYNDLSNKPTIPAAQIQSDWSQTSTTALDYIKNKPTLATVATSGSYNDLSNKPTIPTVNDGTLTIKQNNNNLGTFTANQSTASNINIECAVPSDVEGSKVATGNPLTITDAAPIKAEQMVFGIEPIQDLHGYDKPWFGGAGKNVFNYDQFKNAEDWSESNGVYSGPIAKLYAYAGYGSAFPTQPTWKANTRYTVSLYCLNCEGVGRFRITYTDNTTLDLVVSSSSVNSYVSATTESGKSVSKIAFTYNSGGALSVKEFQIEEGTSRTAWNPYTNICPITGLSDVSGVTCGKNMVEAIESGIIDTTTGQNISGSGYRTKNYVTVGASQVCTISGLKGNEAFRVFYYDINKNYIGTAVLANVSNNKVTLTTDANVCYIRFQASGSMFDTTTPVQVEIGNQATTYEPYQSHTTTIQLGQTVYGGTLTLNADGSAECYVTHGILDLGTRTWTYQSAYTRFYVSYSDMAITPNDQVANAWCSGYNMVSANDVTSPNNGVIGLSQSKNIIIRNTDYTDPALFKASLSGIMLAYPLATPFTIHLTAEQLQLLENLNNISTNAKTLTVKYQPNNAIGEAKGTAQDAMDTAQDAIAMIDALDSIYLKKSNVLMKDGSAVVNTSGYRNIGDNSDYITLSEEGTYLITAWAMFKGGTGNKAILICRASDNAVYGQSWENSTINQSYPKTFTCFHVATVTINTLYFRARVYTDTTDVYGGISGGIYAIKVS